MLFCFEALESTKISSYEPVSSQKYENCESTKMGTGRKFVTLQYVVQDAETAPSLKVSRSSLPISFKHVQETKKKKEQPKNKDIIHNRAHAKTRAGYRNFTKCLDYQPIKESFGRAKIVVSEDTEKISHCTLHQLLRFWCRFNEGKTCCHQICVDA